MTRRTLRRGVLALVAGLSLRFAGCGIEFEKSATPAAAPATSPTAVAPQPAVSPPTAATPQPAAASPSPVPTQAAAPAPVSTSQSGPAAPPIVNPPATARSSASSGSEVQLSLGIALPQTLPEGTALGVSVEYEFVRGGPQSGSRYLLIVQPSNGRPFELEVPLTTSGTIQTFTYDLRPDQGPFTASLREVTSAGETRELSESIELH